MSGSRRLGFTIIEILVSITIFVVSATIMLGALFGSTEVFRRGEASRQAGDEATAVIAALQEDLSRAVPVRLRDGKPAAEWGYIYASVDQAVSGTEAYSAAGNCLLKLVIENPDRSQVRWLGSGTSATIIGVRQRVVWFVDDMSTADPTDDELVREAYDLNDGGALVDSDTSTTAIDPFTTQVVTRGVLHFGVWAEMAQVQAHRQVSSGSNGPDFGWEADTVLPYGKTPSYPTAMALDTSNTVNAATTFYPQPDALRISLVLTGGGRFATRGTLVQAGGTDWRIAGIKALPTVSGSLLRVGDEWIRYGDFRGGLLRDVETARLRSQAATHNRGDVVLAGMPFSLVVALPR